MPYNMNDMGRKKTRQTTHNLQALAVLLFIFSFSLSLILLIPPFFAREAAAEKDVTVKCSGPLANDFRCYAEYYAKMAYAKDKDTVFANIRGAFQRNTYVQGQCHQLTHILGRTAFKKYGSLEAAYAQGDSFCWSGFYHGATEQAIGDIGGDKIKAQLNDICAGLAKADPYSFDHYNCVHGLGHGVMSIDSYELFDSLDTCSTLTDVWERQSCFGGAFMENVMVAVRENGYSKYLKPDDLLYPCNAVDTEYKEQCYLMQSSYALSKNGWDFAGVFKLCQKADKYFRNTCMVSIGRDASGSTNSDVARTIDHCNEGPDLNAKRHCMIGAVKDFVAYYHDNTKALTLCAAFDTKIQKECSQIATEYFANL